MLTLEFVLMYVFPFSVCRKKDVEDRRKDAKYTVAVTNRITLYAFPSLTLRRSEPGLIKN